MRHPAIALLVFAVLVALAIPLSAQAPGRIYHIAILQPTGSSTKEGVLPFYAKRGLMSALAERGFVEGRNLQFEVRVGPPEQLPNLARELVQTHPDVMLAVGPPGARAARDATETIPIIASSSFLLGSGLVTSLARPGGNVSGVTFLTAELDEKRLALLHELVPAARHVALLRDPLHATAEHVASLQAAARALDVTVEVVEAERPEEIAGALRRAHAHGAEAVSVLNSSVFFGAADLLATAAIDAGLPTICQWREMAEAGCLASYGPTLTDVLQMVGRQIATVLHGARVAELPVEQVTRFELLINLRTAKTLGLSVAPTLLARTDEVIE